MRADSEGFGKRRQGLRMLGPRHFPSYRPAVLRKLVLLSFLGLFVGIGAQCSQAEDPSCACLCSDGRFPDCYAEPGSCPLSPACGSDEQCDDYCKSEALCGDDSPLYVECMPFIGGYPDSVICMDIPLCGEVSEEECVERRIDFDCYVHWNFYRQCIGQEGCDTPRCGELLQRWEVCDSGDGAP